MADQVTNYVIQVADKVDPSIERKLDGITASATRAGDSCVTLQASINKVNASGLTSVSAGLRNTGTSLRSLNTSTTTYTRNANSAAAASAKYGAALGDLTTKARAAWVEIEKLATATTAYVAGARAVATAAGGGNPFGGVGPGAQQAAGGVRNMNAALGVARGNLTSANRLAGSFLSTLVGSGPIVQGAFKVLGALALIAVLGEIAHAIYDVVKAYKSMGAAARATSIDQAIAAANGLETVKANVGLTEGFARFLKAVSDSSIKISGSTAKVHTTEGVQDQISTQNELLASQNELNEAGLKSAALAKEKQKSIQAEIDLRQRQIFLAREILTTNALLVEDPHSSQEQVTKGNAQITSATKLVKDLNTQITVLTNHQKAEVKIAAVDGVKDEAKAARLEMAALNKEFANYVAGLNHKLTPPEGLAWWEHAEQGLKHYSDNIDAVNGKEKEYDQQIAARNDNLTRTNEQLDDQISLIGQYSDELKIQGQMYAKVLEYQKTRQPLNATEAQQLRDKITLVQLSAQYQAALGSEYSKANNPLREYIASQQALIKLLSDGAITADQFARQQNQAKQTYIDSVDPMAEYQHGLTNEIALLGKYGQTLRVATQLQAEQERLRSEHFTPDQIAAQTAGLSAQLNVIDQLKIVNEGVAQLYDQNAGALTKLKDAQLALNEARKQGIITDTQYKSQSVQNSIQQAQQQNAGGDVSKQSATLGALAGIMKGYTNIADGATKSFDQFFTTLDNGFANSIAHVLVFGGSIKKALLDTARQAVEGLISSLIKLGIQWLINATLGSAIAAAQAAAMVPIATSVAAAWAPAAAFSSLATLGTNAVPASAAISETTALASILSIAKFASGGEVRGAGTSTSDSIPALLSNGEYVVNATAYAAHKHAIDAINNGARTVYSVANSGATAVGTSRGSSPGLNVEVHNYAGVRVDTEQMSEGRVRMLIHQEGPAVVGAHADGAVATALSDPNSRTSKAATRNLQGGRRNF